MTDAINFADVTILNSPDVRSWPVTAAITRVGCALDGVSFAHTKQDGPDAWPEITPAGFKEPIQFCVWAFFNIGGRWYASAGLEFWKGRPNSADALNRIGADWFYDRARWGPLSDFVPQPGEVVGFMVTSGTARNMQQVGLRERSNIVAFDVPPRYVGTFTFDAPPVEVPPDPPEPPDDTPLWARELIDVLDEAHAAIVALQTDLRALTTQIQTANEHGFRVHL